MTTPEITTEQLLSYAAGETAGVDPALIESYLRANPEAAATVARYRQVQRSVAEDDSVVPPDDVVCRAKAIFLEQRQARSTGARLSWLDRLDTLIASLLFDSRLQPAMGVRSSALLSDRVQLAFHTGDDPGIDIDLQAERLDEDEEGPGRWQVIGQVMAEADLANTPIAFVAPGTTEVVAEARADGSGMFELELPHGTFDLCLGLPARTVIVPNVELP